MIPDTAYEKYKFAKRNSNNNKTAQNKENTSVAVEVQNSTDYRSIAVAYIYFLRCKHQTPKHSTIAHMKLNQQQKLQRSITITKMIQ